MLRHFTYVLFLFLTTTTVSQHVSTLYDFESERITDDLIFDEEGNLYGSDYGGSSVYKISPEGDVSVFATGFEAPNGLAFDSQGNLFLCDNTGDSIYKLNTAGEIIESYGINSPSGLIKMPGSDTLIFTTYQGHTIQKLAPDGAMIPMFSSGELNGPVGLCYDEIGTLYIANFTDRKIFKVQENELELVISLPPPGALGFIAYTQGHIYATAFTADKVYKINPFHNDSIADVYGAGQATIDGPALTTARFNSPNGIRPSLGGDTLFVSQYNDGVIRIITDLALGVFDKKQQLSFEAFPNPSDGELFIRLEEGIQKLKITDTQGRVILSQTYNHHTIETRLNTELSKGMYLLLIENNKGEEGSRRLIIR